MKSSKTSSWIGPMIGLWLIAGPAAAQLRAGAAVVSIEVPESTPLAGYGARGPGNTLRGSFDPVEARALIVEGDGGPRLGIVALDILIIPTSLRESIVSATRSLELDALLIAATHTHSGPGGYVDGWLSEAGIMGWYREDSEHAIAAAAETALTRARRALTPAALGSAVASLPGIGQNRRRSEGPTDASVPVLRVDGATGASIATLFAVAAHPTVLSPDNEFMSADYPGVARANVEAAIGGVAIFLAGPLGDQKPAVASDEDWPAGSDAQRRNATELGGRLATGVIDAAAFAQTAADAAVGFYQSSWQLPPIETRASCVGYVFGPLLKWAVSRTIAKQTTVSALKFGPLRVLGSPLELGVEVAAAIRARSPGPLLIAAHSNDWLGYSLMPEDFARGGYETCLAFHGPQLAPQFVDFAGSVLDGLN